MVVVIRWLLSADGVCHQQVMVGVIRWQMSSGEEAVVMAGVIRREGEGGNGG